MTKKKENWIAKQRRDVQKIFAPKIHYEKEFDILSITWFPQLEYKYSLETSSDFVFDISEEEQVKGIEVFDFKKRFMNKR